MDKAHPAKVHQSSATLPIGLMGSGILFSLGWSSQCFSKEGGKEHQCAVQENILNPPQKGLKVHHIHVHASKQCQLQSSIGKTALHMILSDIVTNALMFLFDRLQITNMYKVKHQLFQSQIMQFLLMEWLATSQHFMCQCSNGIIKSPSLPISFTTFLHVDLNSPHSLPWFLFSSSILKNEVSSNQKPITLLLKYIANKV